jgi:hypothetical protein
MDQTPRPLNTYMVHPFVDLHIADCQKVDFQIAGIKM